MKLSLVLVLVGCVLLEEARAAFHMNDSCAKKGCPAGKKCILEIVNGGIDKFYCETVKAAPQKRGIFFHHSKRALLFHASKRALLFHASKRSTLFHASKRGMLFHMSK